MSEELDLLSDSRPIRYLEGDTVIYRASSIGACERALVASARKEYAQPHPAWFQKVLDEGTENESVISDMWDAKTGVLTVDQQREFNLYIGEIDGRDVYVRAHIDGMAEDESATIREYKKFRDSTWPKFQQQGVEVGKNYPWQVSIAMHALSAELRVNDDTEDIAVEFVGAHYALISGSDETDDAVRLITEVQCKMLHSPPIPLKAIRAKIARVERLINTGFDAREVPCNVNMYPCPYFKIHDEKDVAPSGALEADDQWLQLIADYNLARVNTSAARKQMDAFDAQAKALRAQMIERLTTEGVNAGGTTAIGSWELKWTETPKDAYEVKASKLVKLDVKLIEETSEATATRKPRRKGTKDDS